MLAAAGALDGPPALMSAQALHAAVTSVASEVKPAEKAEDSALDDLDEAALRMAIEVHIALVKHRLCPLWYAHCCWCTLCSSRCDGMIVSQPKCNYH